MNSIPKACLCMMTYNHEQWIRDAIASAFNQDYPNLTIVISDDASTDKTYDIAKEMVDDYDGIHEVILRKSDSNLGRADHFYFLHNTPRFFEADYYFHADGDDTMMSNRVTQCMEVFLRHGVSFVTCNAEIIDHKGRLKRNFREVGVPYDLSIEQFIQQGWNVTCFGAGMAWHRDVYDMFGNFPLGVRNGDQILPFRGLLLNGGAYISNPLIRWRHHENNTTLGVQLEKERDESIKMLITERILCNASANRIIMRNEFVAHLDLISEEKQANLLQLFSNSILQNVEQWTMHRYEMANQGVEIA